MRLQEATATRHSNHMTGLLEVRGFLSISLVLVTTLQNITNPHPHLIMANMDLPRTGPGQLRSNRSRDPSREEEEEEKES